MLQIPAELFVGYNAGAHGPDVAFAGDMSPNEKARKTRIKSIKGRCKDSMVVKNVPMPGFTIKNPGRNWYGSRDYWEILDPRGFKYSVSSENIAKIVECTGITEGLIQSKCVWGYDGGEIVLLPSNSEPYAEATTNSEILSTRVYLRDVKPGNKIVTHDKLTGIYLGAWTYGIDAQDGNYNITKKKYFVELVDSANRHVGYYYSATLKVSSIVETNVLTNESIQETLNARIAAGTARFTESASTAIACVDGAAMSRNWQAPRIVTKDAKGVNISIRLREVTFPEFIDFALTAQANDYHPTDRLCVEHNSVLKKITLVGGTFGSIPITTSSEVAGAEVLSFDGEAGIVELDCETTIGYRSKKIRRINDAKFQLHECGKYYIIVRTYNDIEV